MSGHSKWANIKHKKAKADAERGKVFTRLIKEITVAARHGGGDIEANPRLRAAVAAARGANMPSETIERAIKRGTGELPGVVYEEATLEGYGPGGAALLMELVTDNRNRTIAEIRHILTRHGGNMGEAGCTSWIFEKRGVIRLNRDGLSEDDVMEIALDAGAEDVRSDEENIDILTKPEDLERVKEALQKRAVRWDSAEVTMYPKTTVRVEGEEAERLLKLMNALEEHDDVQHVYSNFDIDVSVMEAMQAPTTSPDPLRISGQA